ncbi:MAG TPA: tripartite tricarboxylate transporter TctB family protein [Xanthobacteraceae bacterium]|nr:tripartite tricarboxylate transporter TctB family protein [Xanthobacteraceae bacterium]
MPSFIKNPKDFLAGLLFIFISALFAYGTMELPIGTAFRMGPGYFPMVLCIMLAALGLVVMFNGFVLDGEKIAQFTWRGLFNIVLPVVFFGVTLRGLGFVLSLGITVFFVSIASVHFKLRTALLSVVVLVFAGWAIFIWGLGLPIQVWGPWVGGY